MNRENSLLKKMVAVNMKPVTFKVYVKAYINILRATVNTADVIRVSSLATAMNK